MKKGRKSDLTNLVLFTQLGLSVVSPIVVCVALGLILRNYAGMPTWALIFFILLGLVSGLSSAWRLVKRMSRISAQNDSEETDDKQDQQRKN